MKKQIVYVKLIPRLFASMIDLFILALLASPLLNMIAPYIFMWVYKPYFRDYKINHITQHDIITLWVNTPEFLPYVSLSSQLTNVALMMTATYLVFGIYFVSFWFYYQASIGKLIMRMKIVNSENLTSITLNQIIKRFLGYLFFIIGIWQVSFSKNRQALHDKIAHTVVIKS